MQSIASRASLTISQPFQRLSVRVARRHRAYKQRYAAMATESQNSTVALSSRDVYQWQSSETTETSNRIPFEPATRSTWSTLKASLRTKRYSISDLFRRSSSTSSSDDSGISSLPINCMGPGVNRDREDSQFCNTLLTLMQRTGRYEYLDFGNADRSPRSCHNDGQRRRSLASGVSAVDSMHRNQTLCHAVLDIGDGAGRDMGVQ